MIKERFELSAERICEIRKEVLVKEGYVIYFQTVAEYLCHIIDTSKVIADGSFENWSLSEKQKHNQLLYAPLKKEMYGESFLNPEYATFQYGEEYGPFLAALYAEMQSLTAYVFEQDYFSMTIRLELFLEIYGLFVQAYDETKEEANLKEIKDAFVSFAYDYQDEFMMDSVAKNFTLESSFAKDIIMNSDLFGIDYLYQYGECITENEIKMSQYMASLCEEEIERIADTFTEGYRKGFIATGKDISIKETVAVRFFIGFERVVKCAIEKFEAMGLKTIIYRAQPSFVQGRNMNKVGYYSTNINKQFDSDHEFDKTLYYTSLFVNRKLECYKSALEHYKKETGVFGGPAVIEDFGEAPFSPEEKKYNYRFGQQERKLSVEYLGKAGALLNQYVKGEERSFTIIAFPIPAIGEKFEEIFSKTIEINTLNYELYRDIQQCIIDTLDEAAYVSIKGQGDNETDLKVSIWKLEAPDKETAFENCVADVNIPVGEVFTSPVLKGTSGLLHVTEVFLNGLKFENLKLMFTDGIITDYSCTNFSDIEQGKKYIKDHVLHQHETLPMGEFAIGTNTVAYKVAKEYQIENVFPILIAEKTGPHFAVGDTCYSHEEDMITYNPNGKAIVARENDYSKLRHEDMTKAYFNCHTDITIPYDELGLLQVVREDGSRVSIIEKGRFVLKGCEELNKSLEDM